MTCPRPYPSIFRSIKAIFDIDSEYIDGLKDDVPLLREIGRVLGDLLSDF